MLIEEIPTKGTDNCQLIFVELCAGCHNEWYGNGNYQIEGAHIIATFVKRVNHYPRVWGGRELPPQAYEQMMPTSCPQKIPIVELVTFPITTWNGFRNHCALTCQNFHMHVKCPKMEIALSPLGPLLPENETRKEKTRPYKKRWLLRLLVDVPLIRSPCHVSFDSFRGQNNKKMLVLLNFN